MPRAHRLPMGFTREGGLKSRHRRKDLTHILHPHLLCDARTPAVLRLFLSTGHILLFPDRTHERRQFFRLVGRLGMEGRMARLVVTEPHANRAGPR